MICHLKCRLNLSDMHKRSRSLTGLDTIEFEKKLQAEAEKENVEPKPLLEQSLETPKQVFIGIIRNAILCVKNEL